MAKAQLKTQPTKQTVAQFVRTIADAKMRRECAVVAKIMQEVTGDKGKMWGSVIAGFGIAHLKYVSGRELDWFAVGFSPRKQSLTLYLLTGYKNKKPLMRKLGKHTIGKSCLYIKNLSDIDLTVLRKLIATAFAETKKKYVTNEFSKTNK